jgi:pimeloyl-ACP methyl ester carboxylesterase
VITPGRAEWDQKSEVGHRAGIAPVLLVHGSADPLIPPGIVYSYAEKTCALGQKNQLIYYPGAGHVPLVESEDDVLAWIADQFAGELAPCNCDNLPKW